MPKYELKIIQCGNNCGKEIEATRTDTYCENCKKEKTKEVQRKYHLKYDKDNAEKIAKYKCQYAKYKCQYAKDNADKIEKYRYEYYEKYPEKKIEIQRNYRKNNPEKRKINEHNRRIRKLQSKANLISPLTPSLWETIKIKQKYKCNHCHVHDSVKRLTMDHMIPLTQGGTNNAFNYQGLCAPCNSKKGNRYIEYPILNFILIKSFENVIS